MMIMGMGSKVTSDMMYREESWGSRCCTDTGLGRMNLSILIINY